MTSSEVIRPSRLTWWRRPARPSLSSSLWRVCWRSEPGAGGLVPVPCCLHVRGRFQKTLKWIKFKDDFSNLKFHSVLSVFYGSLSLLQKNIEFSKFDVSCCHVVHFCLTPHFCRNFNHLFITIFLELFQRFLEHFWLHHCSWQYCRCSDGGVRCKYTFYTKIYQS